MRKKLSAGCVAAILSLAGVVHASGAHAEATNFSYSTVSAGLGAETLDTPICIVGECYSNMALAGLSGSYQFAHDLLVVEIGSQAAANSGAATELTSGVGYFGLGVVTAVGQQIDIRAGWASLTANVEVCINGNCVQADDTGMAYMAGISAWFDHARKFAGHLSLSSTKYAKDDKSYTSTVGGLSFYPNKHHEIRAEYCSGDSSSATMVGYAYHF